MYQCKKERIKIWKSNLLICILLLSFIVVFDCFGKTWGRFSEINSLRNVVSTGRVSLVVLNPDVRSAMVSSIANYKRIGILNDGTLPIKYTVRESSRTSDCNFLDVDIDTSSGILEVGESRNIGVYFSKRIDSVEDINCILSVKVVAWQKVFNSSAYGFSDEEELEIKINIR